jgi:hypothetical protein
MRSDIFETWMQKLNNHFKGQDCKILLIMDNASCHSLFGVQQKQWSGFMALPMTNVTIVFLPPNCTSVVQPLDQGIIAPFKLRYKSKLLEWVLSQFDSDQQQDLRKVVTNVKQTILWSYKVRLDIYGSSDYSKLLEKILNFAT